MSAAPQAFWQPVSDGYRYCLYHEPDRMPVVGRVLLLHPFAEELNTSRRTMAQQARALCEAGHAVLQIDLFGCGDSSGEFGQATWSAWMADAHRALDWLQRRGSEPVWLWGVRGGALLATQLLVERQTPMNLLLWQPVLNGQAMLQQFLRLAMASHWLGQASTAPTAAQGLASGQSVTVAGYELNPQLAHELSQQRLHPPALSPPGRLVWLEVSSQPSPLLTPASEANLTAWREAKWQVDARAVTGPAFWQTAAIVEASDLLQATLAALKPGATPVAEKHENPTAAPLAIEEAPVSVLDTCRAVRLPGPGSDMIGVIEKPLQGSPTREVGVVIVVGGAQYRVGSHRQFVQLARRLASAGYPVLRFDLPGMGDSPGSALSFEETAPHIGAAIDTLQAHAGEARHIVLWGLCDGASANLLYLQATADQRVKGIALLNPWARSEASLARAQLKHYYRDRLLQPQFWGKLLRGGIGWQALKSLGGNVRRRLRRTAADEGFQARMASAWKNFPHRILLLLSERDLTAQEFIEHASHAPGWKGWQAHANLTRITLPGADHTCSTPQASKAVEQHMLDWLEANTPPTAGV